MLALVYTLFGLATPLSLPDTTIVWADLRVAPASHDLGIPIASALDPAGNLVVADMATQRIHKTNPQGARVLSIGRQGDGPGEFKGLYRVAVRADGHILAFDFQRHDITEFDETGEFLSRTRLPFRFSQIDGMVAFADGGVALSGISRWTETPLSSSIHIFDRSLRHLRSFGPVPPTREEWVLERWGVGGISLDPDENILFSLRLPYRIFRFRRDGAMLQEFDISFSSPATPDDIYIRKKEGNRTTYTISDQPILRPHTVRQMRDGWLMAPFSLGEERKVNLLSPEGRVVRTTDMRPQWRSIVAYDLDRGAVWIKGERNLAPIVISGVAILSLNH